MSANSLKLARETVMLLSESAAVSGSEYKMTPLLTEIFQKLQVDIQTDFRGNHYLYKKGTRGKETVILAAHLDEIGLIVTHLDELGFVRFSKIGGLDHRTLLNQEVIIHSSENIRGIITLIESKERPHSQNTFFFEDLAIDIGYERLSATELVQPGDPISLVRKPLSLLNQRIAGKALDNRAGVTALVVCLQELEKIQHQHNVVAITTAQEELGLRGAITGTAKIKPELAVAVDVIHAQSLDTKNQVRIQLGKGPVIAQGPNIHPRVFSELQTVAQDNRLPHQIQAIAGPTGTDARVIQLSEKGIPTGLVSIPLRYMHSSVETLSLMDIVDCGKLLAYFIASLPAELEELTCF